MRITATALLLAFLAVSFAAPAQAEEPVSVKTIQIWKQGEDTRELDISLLDAGARAQLDKQMRARGFVPFELRVLRGYADGHMESKVTRYKTKAVPAVPLRPAPVAPGIPNRLAEESKAAKAKAAAEKSAKADIDRSALREDIRRMLQGDGRLPPDYVPHGTSAPKLIPGGPGGGADASSGSNEDDLLRALAPSLGTLMVRYFEVRSDPVKGPIYERVVRAAAEGLKASGTEGAKALASRVMAEVVRGLEDPKAAPVYGEILEVLAEALPTPKATSIRLPARSRRLRFAGVPFEIDLASDLADSTLRPMLLLPEVTEASVAWKMSLRSGDAILAIDGKPPTPAAVLAAQGVIDGGGQLTLLVRRRKGKIETLELEFEAE